MKIITDNAVYVQKEDISYLFHAELTMPESLCIKAFGNCLTIYDDNDRYEFIKFEAPREIEFFKGIDWIIDYNEVKDLSEEEIIAVAQSILEEKNNIAQIFNSMTSKEKQENMNMVSQCEFLDFKMDSLRNVLWFKQGHIKMQLPEDGDCPAGFKQEKGIRKLIKTLFNKSNN